MIAGDWGKRLLALLVLSLGLPLTAAAGTVVLSTADPDWSYDSGSAEFPPGAQGGLVRKPELLRLDGNFGRGGRHVSAVLPRKLPGARELRFNLRSPASRVTVLLGGADGKLRRVEQELGGGAPEFREIAVPLDGGPLSAIGFLLDQNDLRTDDGFVEVSGVRLVGVPDGAFAPVCRAESPDACFVKPGGGSFRLAVLAGKETFSPEDLRYRWLDYTAKEVASGVAAFDAATRTISVRVPAAAGYFELVFPVSGIRSAVVAAEPYAGPVDEYFGIDLPAGTTEFAGWMRLLRRNGIGWCRDRLPWPAGGVPERYGALREAAAAGEVAVLDTFEEGALRNLVTENLIETARNFAVFAMLPGCGKAVEIASAPNAVIPPEYEVAPLKAVSARFALDKIPTPIVGGLGAIVPGDPDLTVYRMDVAVGLLDDIDALGFTAPGPAIGLEALIAAMHEVEKAVRNGRAGIPRWVSGPGGATPAELVARAVELRALGGAKYFPAAAGLTDANRAPLRPLAAYVHLTRVLAFKEYVGDLRIEGATRARVFSDGREAVACLWQDGEPKPLGLPEGLTVLRAEGIDGRPLEVRDGLVPMTDSVTYLYPDPAGIMEFLDVDTPAMKERKTARDFKPAARAAKPVLIQPGCDPAGGIRCRTGSRVPCGIPVPYRVFFCNLSDQPAPVEPFLNLSGGIRQIEIPGPDGKIERPKFDLLPGTRQEYDFSLVFDPSLARRGYMSFPVGDRGGKAASLVIPVKPYDRARIELPLTGGFSGWTDFSSALNWESAANLPVDIQAKFRVSARPSGLRFEVEVREEVRRGGDGVSLLLQLRRSADDFRGPVVRIRSGRTELPVRSSFQRRDGEISRYVIDVPVSAFGVPALEKGMVIGICIAAESGGGTGVLTWGEGAGEKAVPELFQLLVL